jgi:hypothetical protein
MSSRMQLRRIAEQAHLPRTSLCILKSLQYWIGSLQAAIPSDVPDRKARPASRPVNPQQQSARRFGKIDHEQYHWQRRVPVERPHVILEVQS